MALKIIFQLHWKETFVHILMGCVMDLSMKLKTDAPPLRTMSGAFIVLWQDE